MHKRILILSILLLTFLGCKESILHLKIRFDKIQGLQKDDRVIFEQNQIGTVADVFFSNEGFYTVDILIKKNFANAATEHSKFFIISDPQNKGKKAIEMIQTKRDGSSLKNNTIVEGSTETSAFLNQLLDEMANEFEGFKKQFEEFSEELRGIPESEEFKKLEDELKRFAKEMEQSGKAVREKIQKEVLPRLKEELKKLKERLQKFGREDELKPLEIEMDKMNKI